MAIILTISVTKDQEEKLRLLRKETGVGVSDIIRRALTLYFPTVMPSSTGLGLVAKEQQVE